MLPEPTPGRGTVLEQELPSRAGGSLDGEDVQELWGNREEQLNPLGPLQGVLSLNNGVKNETRLELDLEGPWASPGLGPGQGRVNSKIP